MPTAAILTDAKYRPAGDFGKPAGRSSVPRFRLIAVAGLLALHLAITAFATQPGHLSIDEGIYHQMARSFADDGSLSVWNGYDEFASEELKHPIHRVRDGQLYPQYPYLSAVLAWPFYAALGYRGLFVMNALAYLGVAALCVVAAGRLFGDRRIGLDAVIILTLATFAWEYSQAAWPHMLAVLFAFGSVCLSIESLAKSDPAQRARFAAAAGLLVGIGAGVRLDVVFVLPAIVLSHLLCAPSRVGAAAAAAAGTLPGLAILAATNYAKFGIPSPFTYGAASDSTGELMRYLPLMAAGLLGAFLLWLATRPAVHAAIRQKPAIAAVAVPLALVVAIALPPTGQLIGRLLSGELVLLVDLRLQDPQLLEPGMSRTASGAMVYYGALKKSLLQSLPWLPLILLPLPALFRGGGRGRHLGALLLSCAGYLAVYPFFAWHGGLATNLRYFLPMLPVFAILGAWGMRSLAAEADPRFRYTATLAALASFPLATYLILRNVDAEVAQGPVLTVPLAIAATLAVLLLVRTRAGPNLRTAASGSALVAAAIAMGWASAIAISYDYAFSTVRRADFAARAGAIAGHLQPDSILFVHHETPYFGLYDLDRVRLAATNRDDFEGFRPLLDHHLRAGRPVYLALGHRGLAIARDRGLLEGITLEPLTAELFQAKPTGGSDAPLANSRSFPPRPDAPGR